MTRFSQHRDLRTQQNADIVAGFSSNEPCLLFINCAQIDVRGMYIYLVYTKYRFLAVSVSTETREYQPIVRTVQLYQIYMSATLTHIRGTKPSQSPPPSAIAEES